MIKYLYKFLDVNFYKYVYIHNTYVGYWVCIIDIGAWSVMPTFLIQFIYVDIVLFNLFTINKKLIFRTEFPKLCEDYTFSINLPEDSYFPNTYPRYCVSDGMHDDL